MGVMECPMHNEQEHWSHVPRCEKKTEIGRRS